MATILESIREIRHHIISHSTGRLELKYSKRSRFVDFSAGTIVSARDLVLPCFEEAPLELSFHRMEIPPPTSIQGGGALLVEAMESMDDQTLQRVWEPYKDWTVLLPEDPEIHDTQVSGQLEKGGGRPRRMLQLAVSGALTLAPPAARSMDEEMKEIRTATGRGDYWQVLNIARSASSEEIKKAYRKRVRQFHPDRWYSSGDRMLMDRVECAFRDVRHCYEQAIQAVPRRLSTVAMPPHQERGTPIVTGSAWGRPPEPYPPHVVAPKNPKTASRQGSRVASYTRFGKTGEPSGDSLFRQIFEKVVEAA
jgi:hypothetical protein